MTSLAPPPPNHLFVYGTLQRGHLRARSWPRTPQIVRPGWTRGALWDLGPYPALTDGDDWVLGEIWTFDDTDLPVTYRTLDAIEGCAGLPSDLYRRRTQACYLSHPTLADGAPANQQVLAAVQTAEPAGAASRSLEPLICALYAYFQPLPASSRRIAVSATGEVRWPKTALEEG